MVQAIFENNQEMYERQNSQQSIDQAVLQSILEMENQEPLNVCGFC